MGEDHHDHSPSSSSLASEASHQHHDHDGHEDVARCTADYSRRLPPTLRAVKHAHSKPEAEDAAATWAKDSRDNSGGSQAGAGRTLVVCLDGTGDQFDSDNSNIVAFVSCLIKHSPAQQLTYYQSGIGTYDKGGLKNGLAAGLDMAIGSGLGTHIKDAYRFIMQNYRQGDKICLLGFSRGAYTVRCLAGMLHKVGLLSASNTSQINFAYQFYKDETEEGEKLAKGFKRTFCTHVDVYFLGLWDCVASVGFFPRKLPLSKCPPANTVRYVRHAMALDERRAKFKVCQWNQDDPNVSEVSGGRAKLAHLHRKVRLGPSSTPGAQQGEGRGGSDTTGPGPTDSSEAMDAFLARHDAACERRRAFDTDVLEVWFKGTHADVGGGSVANESRHMLSRIPLRWMVRQCFECDTGILFATDRLAELGLDVLGLYPRYQKLDWSELDSRGGMPGSGLMRKYTAGSLAPLRRRSAVLNIGKDEKKAEAEKDGDESEDEEGSEGDRVTADMAQYILPSEAAEDYFDSREPPSDMLSNKKGWWALEIWPVKIRVLVEDESAWAKKIRLNLGRHRAVRETGPKLHWTVRRLLENDEYKIKGRTTKGTEWKHID
ncbi:hypothetical protein Micbo1qcDRAFT_215281 [Microdochium bolleyi]|uniref:T6SS Phospholipase effector Tle1-like catalytic domain-containing protein n=1 Tax=Microdochium bolleyi TaxID=196109 RepID=A0A136ISW2_9PEZI|nr:hypothetical protein Micbo1qcDRAFT_215281 [Microdochium bolleyi]